MGSHLANLPSGYASSTVNCTAVVESTLVLPGGVMLTTRSGGNVWSYPNTHGDHVAVAT